MQGSVNGEPRYFVGHAPGSFAGLYLGSIQGNVDFAQIVASGMDRIRQIEGKNVRGYKCTLERSVQTAKCRVVGQNQGDSAIRAVILEDTFKQEVKVRQVECYRKRRRLFDANPGHRTSFLRLD
jgi:hypothetical protein